MGVPGQQRFDFLNSRRPTDMLQHMMDVTDNLILLFGFSF